MSPLTVHLAVPRVDAAPVVVALRLVGAGWQWRTATRWSGRHVTAERAYLAAARAVAAAGPAEVSRAALQPYLVALAAQPVAA